MIFYLSFLCVKCTFRDANKDPPIQAKEEPRKGVLKGVRDGLPSDPISGDKEEYRGSVEVLRQASLHEA
jgi:hypothetical protein